MACRKCSSDWVTATGKDCNRCPYCDKQQLFQARKKGRWIEPVAIKQCLGCGRDFEAVGPKQISQRVLCGDPKCRKIHRKTGKIRRESGVFIGPRPPAEKKPPRFCKRCGNGPLNRNQREYCGKTCAGADATQFKRSFMGVPALVRQALSDADWFYAWHHEATKIVSCLACGTLLHDHTGQRKFCDDACRYRFEKPLHDACMDCGCELKADTRHVRRCIECKKKRRKAWKKRVGKTPRKRCERHGVPCDSSVRSRAVFERDGYVCQLCKSKCLKKFTVIDDVPHPLSPTVDHIIAISLGIKGHTWDNVQCACWACNIAKGAKAKGQLRLAIA